MIRECTNITCVAMGSADVPDTKLLAVICRHTSQLISSTNSPNYKI